MRYETECKYCDNALCLFKKYSSDDICKELCSDKNQSFYKKGESIIKIGQPVFGIYMIQKGAIKVVTPLHNNKQTSVRLAKEGSFIGYTVLSNDIYHFDVIAIKDTSVCFIEKDFFENICKNNAAFTYEFLKVFAHEMFSIRFRMEYLSLMNTREKIAEAFLYAIEIFGLNNKTKTINVPLSRQDIAELAGTTTEQVTRQLSEFENEHLILKKKREIHILNIKGLKNIIQSYLA